MKTTILILNWLIVCLCCMASAFVFAISFGRTCCSSPVTSFYVDHIWILWVVPLAWGIATVFFVPKSTPEKIILHTSASVFLGLLTFFFYLLPCIHMWA